MDVDRFDTLARTLSGTRSRRDALSTFVGGTLGLLGLADAVAKKRKGKGKGKKKSKKPKKNAFGCLNVGQPCRGNSANCCSGICQGKKPKKGKQDTSRCVAHDTGTCDQEATGICTGSVPALSTCNNRTNCACFRTTAASNYCAELFGPGLSQCATCQRDADCVAMGLPPSSACAPVSQGFCAGTCPSGMACLIPCGSGAPPP